MAAGLRESGDQYHVRWAMDFREYQQFLADGGWVAMSSQKQSVASLRAEVESLRKEVASMRADEVFGSDFLGRSIAVLGYWVAGVAVVGGLVGIAAWVTSFML